MIEAALAILSTILIAWSCVSRPTTGACAKGWWLPNGIRENGVYACERVPVGGEHRDERGILHDDSIQQPGKLAGRIYCTGGSVPIITSERAVGCQRP